MPPKRRAATSSGRRAKRVKRLLTDHGNPWTPGFDKAKPWHGFENILTKYRLGDLEREGFIDYPADRMPPIDEDHFVGVNGTGRIHPVLRRLNWVDITDDDYIRLMPALRLATCFLNAPAMASWWKGLLNWPWRVLNDTRATAKHQQTLYTFNLRLGDPDDPVCALETVEAWQKLVDMKDHVKWRFASIPRGVHAIQQPEVDMYGNWLGPGLNPRTYKSLVTFQPEFLDILRGNVDIKKFPKAAGFGREEALIRTHYFLALNILHEFCHCIRFAVDSGRSRFEPFFDNYRICEIGSSFESVVFGGKIGPMGYNTVAKGLSCSAPYGCRLSPWPGPRKAGQYSATTQRASPALWGESRLFEYAVPFAYFHKLFTKRFWEQEFPQHGIVSFAPDIWLGVATELEPDLDDDEVADGLVPLPTVQPVVPIPRADDFRLREFSLKFLDTDPDPDLAADSVDTDGSGVDDDDRDSSDHDVDMQDEPAVLWPARPYALPARARPAYVQPAYVPPAHAAPANAPPANPPPDPREKSVSLSPPGGAFDVNWDEDDELDPDHSMFSW